MAKEIFEIPVPIGGTVYDVDFPMIAHRVTGYRVGRMMGEPTEDYEEDYEDGVWYIQYAGGGVESSVPVTEIGINIFPTQEEAEKALKESGRQLI